MRILVVFKIGLCSAISFRRSRRELSIDMAEHRSMLKNYQNTNYPRFGLIPKQKHCPKRVFSLPRASLYYSSTRLCEVDKRWKFHRLEYPVWREKSKGGRSKKSPSPIAPDCPSPPNKPQTPIGWRERGAPPSGPTWSRPPHNQLRGLAKLTRPRQLLGNPHIARDHHFAYTRTEPTALMTHGKK